MSGTIWGARTESAIHRKCHRPSGERPGEGERKWGEPPRGSQGHTVWQQLPPFLLARAGLGGKAAASSRGSPDRSAVPSQASTHRGSLEEREAGWGVGLTRGLAHSDLALALEQGCGGCGCQLFTGGSFGGEVGGW